MSREISYTKGIEQSHSFIYVGAPHLFHSFPIVPSVKLRIRKACDYAELTLLMWSLLHFKPQLTEKIIVSIVKITFYYDL